MIGQFKRSVGMAVTGPSVQGSIFGGVVRGADRVVGISPEMNLAAQLTARPHYAYCLLNAAHLAKRFGHARISAIEFGVAGGNGLVFMVNFAR